MLPSMSTFLNVQGRGTVALPPDIRRRYGLDEPGAQVELVERDDGVLELRPCRPVHVIPLGPADSELVARLILDPPAPNDRLRRALTQLDER
jgi:bifunctional DNA-binding transcriptional regulator/antitoxin component of YhaV-PrlF toxin-antitoxin module